MKKGFIGIMVLVLVALVVPKLISNTAYDVYKQSIENYPMDKGLVSIEHREYLSSWFSSDVVTVVSVESFNSAEGPVEFLFPSHIQHGPMMFTEDGIKFGLAYVDTKLSIKGLSKESQDMVDNILNTITIKMNTLIGFDEKQHDEVSVGSYTYGKDDVTATFGGFDMVGTSLLDYSKMDGTITFHESSVKSPEFTLNIAPSLGSYDLRKYFDSMMLGNVQGQIPSIDIVTKQISVSLENIVFSGDETEENKNLYFNQQFSIGKIKAPVPVEALEYDVELNKVSIQAIEDWIDFSQTLQPKAEGLSAEDEKKLRELAGLALQEGLELNQYLKLDGMGGHLPLIGIPDMLVCLMVKKYGISKPKIKRKCFKLWICISYSRLISRWLMPHHFQPWLIRL